MQFYLGETLKKLRTDRGWTQKELGFRLNKSITTVSGYESDRHPVPLDVLVTISEIFGISLDDLVGLKKTSIILTNGLDESQIHILEALRKEYLIPTGHGSNLTSEQMQILHDIIQSFAK